MRVCWKQSIASDVGAIRTGNGIKKLSIYFHSTTYKWPFRLIRLYTRNNNSPFPFTSSVRQ